MVYEHYDLGLSWFMNIMTWVYHGLWTLWLGFMMVYEHYDLGLWWFTNIMTWVYDGLWTLWLGFMMVYEHYDLGLWWFMNIMIWVYDGLWTLWIFFGYTSILGASTLWLQSCSFGVDKSDGMQRPWFKVDGPPSLVAEYLKHLETPKCVGLGYSTYRIHWIHISTYVNSLLQRLHYISWSWFI